MPRAKKLKSGAWRVQVYSHTDADGKQHKKSITASTKKEAERLAAQYVYNKSDQYGSLTLGEAIDKYIANREAVLSPATVATYKQQRNKYCKTLMNTKLINITNEKIQRAINAEAINVSPKTVRNIYGLITATLKAYRPDMVVNVKLPQKKRPELAIPGENDVDRILNAVKGTRMELPVLLAVYGPMRRGEIAALRYEHISGNTVHVCENMVKDSESNWIVKTTKSYAGDRYIVFPDVVASHFDPNGEGSVCSVTPDYISHTWQKIKKKLGIDCRFHDLRHYCASILHTMMPDQYIMERGGWSTDATLKSVYRHSLSDQSAHFNQIANSYFDKTSLKTSHETKTTAQNP